MRNDTTDAMADALQRSFVGSGLEVTDFIAYLDNTRDLLDVCYEECAFFVNTTDYILHFYYAGNRWQCKA